MAYLRVGDENSDSIDLYYEDHGRGKPVVLIHGWPLSGRSWEKQFTALWEAGYRVISYDRRGFGKSSQPAHGYNYDTFADDLNKLMKKLDLRDATLIGFSMGAGEVVRYLGAYGSERVSRAVLIAPVAPFLLKTPDNPVGVEPRVFEGIEKSIAADRLGFLTQFFRDFYNLDAFLGKRISDEVVRDSWNVASGASPIGTLESVAAWVTDFRDDLPNISVPTLIIQGDADRITPINSTGIPLQKAIAGSRLVKIEGAPHGLLWTHADRVNSELMEFLSEGLARRATRTAKDMRQTLQ